MSDTQKIVATAVTAVIATNYAKTVIRKRALRKAIQAERAHYVTFDNQFGGQTTVHVDFVDSLSSILNHLK